MLPCLNYVVPWQCPVFYIVQVLHEQSKCPVFNLYVIDYIVHVLQEQSKCPEAQALDGETKSGKLR